MRRADREGLTQLRRAAFVSLVAALLGVINTLLQEYAPIVQVSPTTTGPNLHVGSTAPLWAGLAIGLPLLGLELLFLRFAFRALLRFDTTFSTPSGLSLLALAGLPILAAGYALLIAALLQAVGCAGAGNPVSLSCLLTPTFSGAVGLLVIGGLLTLIGYVGVLVGIWRFGTHFDNGLFKAGAILLIFPLLALVGAILLLVGAARALERLPPKGAVATFS